MKERFRVVQLGNRDGMFYCKDKLTGSRTSLKTNDRKEADRLVQHKNEALKNPVINRKIGMAHLSVTDPKLTTRTWEEVWQDILKDKNGPNLRRWQNAERDPAMQFLRKKVVVTTLWLKMTPCPCRAKLPFTVRHPPSQFRHTRRTRGRPLAEHLLTAGGSC